MNHIYQNILYKLFLLPICHELLVLPIIMPIFMFNNRMLALSLLIYMKANHDHQLIAWFASWERVKAHSPLHLLQAGSEYVFEGIL